ncbi:hypothetical protein [Gordonia caeni]|uniref:Mammalian cell entry protein n=1 Tax=Gordonia caeni TaxID=1007097 RepID=A0ABP7NWL0_9ACTN
MSVRRIGAGIFAFLVTAVLVVTIVLGVMYARADAVEKSRASALEAAKLYSQKMYAWTPENISDNINFMMAHLTGPAKEQYERNILGERIAEQVKEQKVVSTITDQGAGVVENTRDTAKVLLFINQSASRADSEDIQVTPSRIVYTMERRSDTWIINDAQIIDDETLKDLVDGDGDGDQPQVSIPASVPPTGEPAPTEPAPEPVPTG